jgi:beta-fructofuranosidase
MAGGAVLVHDVVEEQEGVAVVDAGGVILSVDEQQHYVALADGPGDVEAYYGLGSGSEEKSRDDWGSVGVIGKNGRRALLLLALGWLAALVFVGMRSVGWQKVWSGSNGTAIALKDPPLGPGDPGVPIPYPKTLTAYHCRPAKNWISDPCGPMYYKGYYHIFYQYNPGKAVWGNITWGHGVSKDMVQWTFLHPALAPKEWYDIKGTWSGSVTIRPDGLPLIYYTGSSAADEQMASIAEPKDPSDPLLREWVKYTHNPILRPPPAILIRDFRDPTTAWMGADGVYRLSVGSKIGRAGVALMYKSKDLYNWEYQGEENLLHAVAGTGMWECVDFYPVGPLGEPTPPLGTHGPGVHHVLKVSLDDERHDWYALGFYDTEKDIFIPDNPIIDVGIGLRYNYGKFYASKSFIDPVKQRRIIWGFVNESDPEVYDLAKGWNTVMGIPRTVWYDNDTGINVIQLPIDEINQLRGSKLTKKAVHLPPGSVVPVEGAIGDQLDIEVVFEYPNVSIVGESEKNLDEHFECGQGGAQARGTFGPFGLLLLADKNLTELSAVFFYISHVKNAGWTTRFCADPTRGSLAKGIDTTIYGSFVNVLESEDFLSARIFVDKSVIETFVQGGRMTVNMRAYPTIAYESNANVFFFNNGTSPIKVRSIDVWQMQAATMLNL